MKQCLRFRLTALVLNLFFFSFSQSLLADIHKDLIAAVKLNDTARVAKLLKKGAFVNVLDEKYGTPLYIAAKQGSMPLVILLLKAGADINRGHADGETPLMIALYANKKKISKYLMSQSPDLKLKTIRNINMLMYAAAFADLDFIKKLLATGLDINDVDADDDSVLHYCVGTTVGKTNCSLKSFRYLVSSGADINLKSRRKLKENGKQRIVQFSVLEYAAQFGRLKIVRYLLEEKSVKVGLCKVAGHNAFEQAILYNQLEVVRYLLKNHKNYLNQECIFTAIITQSTKKISKTIKLLLTEQYFQSLSLKRKKILVATAMSPEHIDYFRYLVEAGIISRKTFANLNPAQRDLLITTALTLKSSTVLAVLFKSGIIDSKTRVKGQLLIDFVDKKGREAAYGYLLSRGVVPRRGALGDYIRRLVFRRDRLLSQSDRLKMLTRLAYSGASSYLDESTGDTFLTLLYKYKDLGLAKYILSKHKNYINKANKEGNTPLMLASQHGNIGLLKLLLENGANPAHINNNGKSALLLAIDGKRRGAARILVSRNYDNTKKIYLKQINARVSLLIYTLVKRERALAHFLLKRRTDLSEQEASQVIYFSIKNNYNSLFKLAVAKRPAINRVASPFTAKKFALDLALENNRTRIFKSLLALKAKYYHGTPGAPQIMTLATANRSPMLRLLLAQGLDVNKNYRVGSGEGQSRMSLLNYSLRKGSFRIVRILLKAKANPNVWDSKGRTALFYTRRAVRVQALLLAGANINHEDKSGQTPLSLAVSKSNLSLVKLLLESGANPNVGYSETGATHIMVAAWHENIALIRLLIKSGADAGLQASNSRLEFQNAYQIAENSGNLIIRSIFRKARK